MKSARHLKDLNAPIYGIGIQSHLQGFPQIDQLIVRTPHLIIQVLLTMVRRIIEIDADIYCHIIISSTMKYCTVILLTSINCWTDPPQDRLETVTEAGLPIWITELDVEIESRLQRAQGYENVLRLYFRFGTDLYIHIYNYFPRRECDIEHLMNYNYILNQLATNWGYYVVGILGSGSLETKRSPRRRSKLWGNTFVCLYVRALLSDSLYL